MNDLELVSGVLGFMGVSLFLSRETSKSHPLPYHWRIFIYTFPFAIGVYLLVDILLSLFKVVGQGGGILPILIVGYLAILTILKIKYNPQKNLLEDTKLYTNY